MEKLRTKGEWPLPEEENVPGKEASTSGEDAKNRGPSLSDHRMHGPLVLVSPRGCRPPWHCLPSWVPGPGWFSELPLLAVSLRCCTGSQAGQWELSRLRSPASPYLGETVVGNHFD